MNSEVALKCCPQKPGSLSRSLLDPWNAGPRLRCIVRSEFIPAEFNRVARALPMAVSFSNGFALELVNRHDVALAIASSPVLREANTGAASQPDNERKYADDEPLHRRSLATN